MALDVNTLPNDYDALKAIIMQLQDKVLSFEEQFRLAQYKKFAASSEKCPEQDDLFNEAEQSHEPLDAEVSDTQADPAPQTRQKPGRKPLPKNLPREEIVHDIADADKVCDGCQGALHKISESRSEQLEFIPAQVKVIEHVRPKYSCRNCEKNTTAVNIKTATLPARPIPKSMATPSLLSQVISYKYQFALPLYRQEALFKQYGIELNRKTLANWMMQSAELLNPIIALLKKTLLQQRYLHADETPLKVIHDDKQKSYMWVYCSGSDSPKDQVEKNIVLYDYHASRAGQCPANYLNGFNGHLVVDGYSAYEQTSATLAGCMAHARRKFIEAQKAQVKGKSGKADWAVNHIKKLYRIEKQIADLPEDERQKIRLEQSKPLLEQFKAWLDKSANQVLPQSAIGKAVAYALKQWSKLACYIEAAYLPIDNNRAERAVKPFVIGRKNWLFSNTAKGATASANLYSIIETAKANGLDPYRYLNYLFEEIPDRGEDADLNDLMPWVVNC